MSGDFTLSILNAQTRGGAPSPAAPRATTSPRARGRGEAHTCRSTISALDVGDGLGRVEVFRAGLGAVHDGVAAVEPERVFQIVEPLAGRLVARVGDPAVGLQERGRAEIAVGIPPIARARGRAAGAQDALVEPVEFLAVVVALLPLLLRRRRHRVQPRLDRGVLGVKIRQIGHQVLDHRQMRQRIDLDRAVDLARRLDAGERVGAVDVHRARAANALAAGAAEGQRRIDVVLDPDERIENHRAAVAGVDIVGVDARIVRVVRIPAVDAVLALGLGLGRMRPGLAFNDLRVFRQRELDHDYIFHLVVRTEASITITATYPRGAGQRTFAEPIEASCPKSFERAQGETTSLPYRREVSATGPHLPQAVSRAFG